MIDRRGATWKGKSLEERLGSERAAEVRAKIGQANRGRKNTSETKQKMREAALKRMTREPDAENTFKKTIRGWYKGVFFRSSYEFFFLKNLESKGIPFKSIECERFRIPYVWEGEEHVYVPDFSFTDGDGVTWVYEIKPKKLVDKGRNPVKFDAARIHFHGSGLKFVIITEDDIVGLPTARKMRLEIKKDPCVFLVPEHIVDDRWGSMFKQQDEFMRLLQEKRTFPQYPLDLSKKDHQRVIKEISHDCMHELFEAVHLLKNSKLHRATNVSEFDRESFLEELADVAHYLIEIFILLGISPKQAFSAYMRKGTINKNRILNGY